MKIWKIYALLQYLHHGLLVCLYRNRFGKRGINFKFDPKGDYCFENIYCGDHVYIGPRPSFIATRSKIYIGNHVMFGPEVSIQGGNHRIDLIGRYMDSVKDHEKRPEDDRDIYIEDDVWVGTRVIILSGIRICRGAVIAAGAVVTKDVPPYAIVAGVPAGVIKFRWGQKDIEKHERNLYSRGTPRD